MNNPAQLAVLAVVLGVPLAALAWRLLAGRWGLGADFLIRRDRRGRVQIRGRLPLSKHPAIREFFGRDIEDVEAFAVRGNWGPGRPLQLRWHGRLAPGCRQRVRNFLMECLR